MNQDLKNKKEPAMLRAKGKSPKAEETTNAETGKKQKTRVYRTKRTSL